MAVKGKTYRTSSGKQVDFGALLLANETMPALGNMNVNARGDHISSDGTIVKSREDVMREHNALHTMVPQDSAIPESSSMVADDDWEDWTPPVKPSVATTSAEVVSDSSAVAPTSKLAKKIPAGGLAAAVAKAKTVDPAEGVQLSFDEQAKAAEGVRRI